MIKRFVLRHCLNMFQQVNKGYRFDVVGRDEKICYVGCESIKLEYGEGAI